MSMCTMAIPHNTAHIPDPEELFSPKASTSRREAKSTPSKFLLHDPVSPLFPFSSLFGARLLKGRSHACAIFLARVSYSHQRVLI
jgi:hypothetical protein